jgi:hypothetical protein
MHTEKRASFVRSSFCTLRTLPLVTKAPKQTSTHISGTRRKAGTNIPVK